MMPIERLLTLNGFHLIRNKKHQVWRNGRTNYVFASTASDHRAYYNQVAELKRICKKAGLPFIETKIKRASENQGADTMNHVSKQPFNPMPLQRSLLEQQPSQRTEPPKQQVKRLDKEAAEICRAAFARRENQAKIADALNALGYRHHVTGLPVDAGIVSAFMIENGMRYRKPKAYKTEGVVVAEPKKQTGIKTALEKITDVVMSNLQNDEVKMDLILMYTRPFSEGK